VNKCHNRIYQFVITAIEIIPVPVLLLVAGEKLAIETGILLAKSFLTDFNIFLN